MAKNAAAAKNGTPDIARAPQTGEPLLPKGYGSMKRMLDLDPSIDLTKPVWEQVFGDGRNSFAVTTVEGAKGGAPRDNTPSIACSEGEPFIRASDADPALRPEGYGVLKGRFSIRPDIDLTKPIWEQVFANDREILEASKKE